MKIVSVPKATAFGVKLPVGFTEKIVKRCDKISLEEAGKIAERIQKAGSDSITFTDIISIHKGFSSFNNCKNIIKMQLEAIKSSGVKTRCTYTDIIQAKKAFDGNELAEYAEKFISKTEQNL